MAARQISSALALMPTKQQLNSLIRKKAAETLFSALSALNIRAILMGSPAIALYDASQRAAKVSTMRLAWQQNKTSSRDFHSGISGPN